MRINTIVFLRFLLSGVLVGLSWSAAQAQLALTRTYFTSTYTSINGAPGAVLSTSTGDDGIQTGINIGFTFNYLGTNYTQVDITTNGSMAMNGFGITNVTRVNGDFYTTTGPNGVIAPWCDDLSVDGSSSMWTQLTGTPGLQVFTIEWNNVLTYYTGSTQRINFQVKLYETTNVIEFIYGTLTAGTPNTGSESASILLENGTGGAGNYLDVATGSSNVGNYHLIANTSWPTRNYRFTPGAPTALLPGAYTAGSSGTYPNLSEAIADINHRGVSGPVVISLTDATYSNAPAGGDNWFPMTLGTITGTSAVNTIVFQPVSGTSTLSYEGVTSTGGSLANSAVNAVTGTTTEPILAIMGSDYVGFTNVNLTATSANVDRGISVMNNGTTNGSTFIGLTNSSITLNRTNTSTIAIDQRLPSTPAASTGTNSNNAYMNLNISNTYGGIFLNGNATFPDMNCQVGTTAATTFNTIGGTTANDIGNGTSQTYGIRLANQSGASVFNNNVQNVGGSAVTTDGIFIDAAQGTTNVFRNNVSYIRGLSTTSTSGVTGIRAQVATSAGHSLRIYNNSVSNILTAYTSTATATIQLRGIFVQPSGGGLTSTNINVDHNTVYMDQGANLNISSAAYAIGTTSGPVINTRNNIFVNAAGAQTAPAIHVAWRSTSATVIGNTGSVSNFNDLYIPNPTQGFVGQGNTTNYATLANWQAAMTGQDANSVSGDPLFLNVPLLNFHATAAVTNNIGTPIAWVTSDIDNQTRSLTTPDAGYDEYTPTTLDVGAVALIAPTAGVCYSASEPVTIQIRNWAVNTIDFSTNNVTVTVNVTGAVTATLNITLTSGTLAPSATMNVSVGTLNMSTAGTYTFNATATTAGDGNTGNDAMAATNRVFSAGTALASPGAICAGDSTALTLSGQNGSTLQWQISTDGGSTWNSIPGATTSPYNVSPADTAWYRALVCGLITSIVDTVNVFPTTPPTTTGDTICGTGVANLAASGAGTLLWYDAMSGGSIVNTGSTYSPTVGATTTYYVQSNTGSQQRLHQTTYAAGNGSSGNVFTVRALTNITVTGFDGHHNTTAGTLHTWEIWYRPDDYLLTPGSHLSNAGWTQLGTASNVPSAGPGNITAIPIALSLTIPANTTYSFQVFANSGVAYTNGTTLGALYNANSDLEVYQGHGGTAFSGMVNSPRVFNGRIHYSVGCESNRTAVTATVTPADSIVIAPASAVSCGGDSVALNVSSTNAGYVYTWSPGGTLNTTSGSSVVAGPLATTDYMVTGVDSAGCQASDTVKVTYIDKPVVTAMVIPDTVCAGDSVALTSAVSPIVAQIGTGTITNSNTSYPSPFGNYYWGSRHQMLILASELQALNLGSGFINAMSFDVTNLNLAVAHDNFEIKLALTSVNAISTFQAPAFTSVFFSPSYLPAVGVNPIAFSTPFYWDGVSNILVETCHNNAAYVENVSVNQSTTPFSSTVYYRADAAGVCVNNTVTGTIAQRPNMYFWMASTYSYDWQPSANLVDPTAPSTMGMALASTDYILMVTDSATGCVGVDTTSLFAYPGPNVNLGPDGFYCGTSTTLDAGNPGSTYLWNTLDSSQTILATSNGTYSVDVTDTIGCSASDTVVITFTPNPTVDLGPDTSACQGQTIVLDAGFPGSSYSWSTTATSQTIPVTATGNYSVQVTDTFGCSGADTVSVTFNALPSVSYTSPIDTLCSDAGTVGLTGGSPLGGVYSGTGVSAGTFNPGTAGVGSHTITYTFTDGNGCSNSATEVIVVETCPGFADGFNTLQVGLYPNPNNGRFTFSVSMDVAADLTYEVADARGVVVLREHTSQPSGLYKQEVDLTRFSAGVYTLHVKMDGKTAVKRLVVQR